MTVPAEVGHAAWIDTDDLSVYPYGGRVNPGHYDAQGQVALGIRFANALVQLPEPGATALVGTGLISVLCGGWLRRGWRPRTLLRFLGAVMRGL